MKELTHEQAAEEFGFDLLPPDRADLKGTLAEVSADSRQREIESRTRLLSQAERLPAPFGDLIGVDFSPQYDDSAVTVVEQDLGSALVTVKSGQGAVIRPSFGTGGNPWAWTYGADPSVVSADDIPLVQTRTRDGGSRLYSVDAQSGEVVGCVDGVAAVSAASADEDVVTVNGPGVSSASEPQVARSDPQSGEVRWQRSPTHLSDLGPAGITVADDLALASSFDLSAFGGLHALDQSSRRLGDPEREEGSSREEGSVVAYSLDTGKEAWRYPTSPQSRSAASSLGSNEEEGVTAMLVMTCACGAPKGDPSDATVRTRLVVVDSASGEVQWQRPGPTKDTDWSYAALWGDRIVLDAGDDRLQAFDLHSGQRAWTAPLETAGVRVASAPVDGRRLVVTGNQLLRIDPHSGAVRRSDFPQGTPDPKRFSVSGLGGPGINIFDEHIVLDYQGAMLVFERSN